ncbi:MAG: nucleotidyltransferase substrate binding protein [Synergistaceae bacterium]|nr:nucleotidyltransferase substrate binding protein [Synergistaceae bacterium]
MSFRDFGTKTHESGLEISSLIKSLASLERALSVTSRLRGVAPEDEMEILRAGVIQNFEFCYEVCWKMMKRWIEFNRGPTLVSGVPQIELFRVSAENGLITDVAKWMEFHRARNSASHMYNDAVAEDVFEKAVEFYSCAADFLKRLEARL